MAEQPILVSAGMDGTIRFWNAVTQKNYLILPYEESQVNNLCITPDGTQLAAGAWQNIRMYSLQEPTARGLHTYSVHDKKNVMALGFQADGNWMYTGGEDGMTKIWDMRATQLNCQRIFELKNPVYSVALHPNQVELMIADSTGALYVWDIRTDHDDSLLTEVDMSEYILHVDIDKTGRQCAAVTNRGNLFLWNINHNGVLALSGMSTNDDSSQNISNSSFNNFTNASVPLLTSKNTDKVKNTSPEMLKPDLEITNDFAIFNINGEPRSLENGGSLSPLAAVPSSLNLPFVQSNQQPHKKEHVENNKTFQDGLPLINDPFLENYFHQQMAQKNLPAFFPSQNFGDFYNTGLGSNAHIRPCIKIPAHSNFTLKCRFRPDSLAIATTSADRTAKLWCTGNYKLINTYTVPSNKWVWECAFTNDSMFMITASSDGLMRMWDLAKNEVVRTYTGHSLGITAMAFRDCYNPL